MFGLEDQQKEVFPYNYYTLERFRERYGSIREAELYLKEEDREQFRNNISQIVKCQIGEGKFDLWKYSEFYCQQDVSLLRKGFMKFSSRPIGFMTAVVRAAHSLITYVLNHFLFLP